MFFLKLIYHINTFTKKFFLKLIYGKSLVIGNKVSWRKSITFMIQKGAIVKIGNNCFFNNNCSVNANEKVLIGNNSIFGENVKIYDHNHHFNNSNEFISNQGFSNGTVQIGNNCWIGSNVIILKDTKIGDNVVVGAGTVVKGHIPSNKIVKQKREYDLVEIKYK